MKKASLTSAVANKAAAECARILFSCDNLPSKAQLQRLKGKASKKFGSAHVVGNAQIREQIPEDLMTPALSRLLKTKDVRSLSGISAVAIMAKPALCPGECIYCPRGKNAPQSYTGFEPATMRAIQNNYDAFRMVSVRLAQFKAVGHGPQKCELIVMGGTFNAQSEKYQKQFVKRAFDAFNNKTAKTLEEAFKLNEKAKHRVIGLTFETRPDFAGKTKVSKLVDLGATRVELGVQSIAKGMYEKVRRNHSVDDVVQATTNCKNAFLKVGYHMMPGLFSTPKKDVAMFKKIFSDSRFKPDMLKIYPCLVMPNTVLHDLWKKGEFTPYAEEEAIKVLLEIKKFVPKWVRIMRVERDIPSDQIAGGITSTNLRQMALEQLKKKNYECQCIRCREAGLRSRDGTKIDFENASLERIDYNASNGTEVFLSFEDKSSNSLLGFLRLRSPSVDVVRPEISKQTAGVRELHVYGEQVPIGARKKKAVQHKGFGAQLLDEAERISKEEFDAGKLLVISGVGVREYYRKQGYKLQGAYMAKGLR
ncbi:MAG: tRNA uridine(34) 5-carboxymethylaminomethyl modification radical SAM/GNAT enzyme Elp3 [Candidatus Micrarchaeia archaeon]